MAKLTIVAEIDLNNPSEASDLLSSISGVMLDMADACDGGKAETFANTSGLLKNDEEDDEEPFGNWKWE